MIIIGFILLNLNRIIVEFLIWEIEEIIGIILIIILEILVIIIFILEEMSIIIQQDIINLCNYFQLST